MINQPQRIEQARGADNVRRLTELKRVLLFPVPVDAARARLNAAFASPISVSKGFPFARVKYTGQVDGDNIDVRYTSYGKSTMSYRVCGQLYADPRGSRLEMTIRDRYWWGMIIPPLFAFVGCAFFSFFTGLRGFALLFTALLMGSFVAIILGGLSLVMGTWHRRVAADSIVALLQNIVANYSK